MWAGNAIVGRLMNNQVPPMTLNLLRWVVAAVLLAPLGYRVLQKTALMGEARSRLALLGFDDVADHIKFERIYTTKTWQHDYNVFQGAVFNLSHNWSQIGPLRPHCKSEDIDGLYWVGGGTHPGSGLVTIFESAKIAADALKQASQARPSGRLGKLALTAKTFLQR